jgi:hypothetical protein
MDREMLASGRWPAEWLEYLMGDSVAVELDFYHPPTVGQAIDRCLAAGIDATTGRALVPIRQLSRRDAGAVWLVTRSDARHLLAVYAGVSGPLELAEGGPRDLVTAVRFRDDLLSITRSWRDGLEPFDERHVRFGTDA